MESDIKRWRWKSTTIDFGKIPYEYPYGQDGFSKKEYIFKYLPLPDEEIRRLYNETV